MFRKPLPALPIRSSPVPEQICKAPDEAVVVRFIETTLLFVLRLSVPVFVRERFPVPEIVLLMVKEPVALN
jgi:hypothetical protein